MRPKPVEGLKGHMNWPPTASLTSWELPHGFVLVLVTPTLELSGHVSHSGTLHRLLSLPGTPSNKYLHGSLLLLKVFVEIRQPSESFPDYFVLKDTHPHLSLPDSLLCCALICIICLLLTYNTVYLSI